MPHKKITLIVVLLLGLRLTALQAQQAVPASGGNASGSGGTASYTIGQVAYTNNSGSGGTVTQGVQQDYEIFVLTGKDLKGIEIVCTAYPNPVINYLTLNIEGGDLIKYFVTLFDMTGKILLNKQTGGSLTALYMENLVSAPYILKVADLQGKEIKTFKIVKY